MGCSKVYALLAIREATVGAVTAVVHNAAFPVVLFMRCAGCRHVVVPCTSTSLYRCAGLHTAYVSCGPYLLVQPCRGQCQLGQSLLSGMRSQSSGSYGSLVRNCRKIEEHAASGLTTGRPDLWDAAGMVGEVLQRGPSQRARGRITEGCQNAITMSDGVSLGLNWVCEKIGSM